MVFEEAFSHPYMVISLSISVDTIVHDQLRTMSNIFKVRGYFEYQVFCVILKTLRVLPFGTMYRSFLSLTDFLFLDCIHQFMVSIDICLAFKETSLKSIARATCFFIRFCFGLELNYS